QVSVQEVNYWVRVQTAAHTMTVSNANQLVSSEPVAVGTGGTPTPLGIFYLTELLRPLGQPWYGPYAYSLSAHSDVLQSFMGGDGTIGIHGTNSPGSIGRARKGRGCGRRTGLDHRDCMQEVRLPDTPGAGDRAHGRRPAVRVPVLPPPGDLPPLSELTQSEEPGETSRDTPLAVCCSCC